MKLEWSQNGVTKLCQCVLALCFAVWLLLLRHGLSRNLWFDDSYMFYRYAINIHHGLGISWNHDASHTYGETAQLWGLLILLLSYLPLNPSQVLSLGSWLASIAAILAMAWAVRCGSRYLDKWRTLALVAAPLVFSQNFPHNASMGMETMLAVALGAFFLGSVLLWVRGVAPPELAGVVAIPLFLTRPESALLVLLSATLVVALWQRGSVLGLIRLLATFAIGAALDLVLAKLYFHTALPLSFYIKSSYGYEGYARYWHPTIALFGFLSGCLVYLLLLVFLTRRHDRGMVLAFLLPAIFIAAYLNFVLQIMNDFSRYYVPLYPFLVVPALLVLDRRLGEPGPWFEWFTTAPSRTLRFAAAAILLFLPITPVRMAVAFTIDRQIERKQFAYDPAQLITIANTPLPPVPGVSIVDLWHIVPDRIFSTLPAGATVASSEVGYLGARLLTLNVIDLEGLNDTAFARYGFSVSNLLARKPDAIWLPHPDYSWQRGMLLSDPEFLRQYEIYAGMAETGIAIRRDSPYRRQLEHNIASLWTEWYPNLPMSGYLVTQASWSHNKHVVPDTVP